MSLQPHYPECRATYLQPGSTNKPLSLLDCFLPLVSLDVHPDGFLNFALGQQQCLRHPPLLLQASQPRTHHKAVGVMAGANLHADLQVANG